RPLRACRFAAQLNFQVEPATMAAISQTLPVFQKVAAERVHDELIKMLSANKPSVGLELMRQSGLLKIVLPELDACFGVAQPPEFHPHDVYWHSLYSCDAAPINNLSVRLAALFHDLGKPSCKVDHTFYNHDQAGAKMVEKLMKRLKFSASDTDKVVNLVANHMFDYSNKWSDSAVRRFIRRIGGVENVGDLFALRRSDTKAMKLTVGSDYLVELQKRIDKIIAEENALHIRDLKVNGLDVMEALKVKPGPKVGEILDALLEKVLDDPALNTREILLALIKKHE
ncbi:MAG: HD domain-containing protein, partial [bacterium]